MDAVEQLEPAAQVGATHHRQQDHQVFEVDECVPACVHDFKHPEKETLDIFSSLFSI